MKISDVRIRLVNKEDNNIKVIESPEGAFIAMPSRKTNDGEYKDIAHPLNTETRENLKQAILTAYYDELKK